VADRPAATRLIAVEGADSEAVRRTAADLQERVTTRQLQVMVSRWDASALFTDCAAAPVDERDISPRTLMLLYAADLAFRVRWEIQPALAEGHVVIAAPYVATAIAFGTATGLSHEWLTRLFSFAPSADRTLALHEPKNVVVWKRRPERGFGECCTALLSATPQGFARRKTRTAMVEALAAVAERQGGPYRRRDRRELVDAIVMRDDRRAASRPTRPRER
jgi:hypothetical protein